MTIMGHKTHFKLPSLATNGCILALAALVCLAEAFPQQQQGAHLLAARQRAVFARRAADDSRPLPRSHPSSSDEPAVVVGKFRAPAPEQVRQQRIPKMNKFGSQTMTASFRVADSGEQPEKIVHGVLGASSQQAAAHKQQRTVGAKIQVSDEGLNYPPSKLSADIYGNVAEIVTAPPEAVESDFLIPTSSRYQQQQQQQRPQQRQPRNARRYL